jgi:hypothetical protein
VAGAPRGHGTLLPLLLALSAAYGGWRRVRRSERQAATARSRGACEPV